MNQAQYDVIVIGAGHNGLVTAAYMAKAGRRVLDLESRSIVGGSVVTESFGDGFEADSIWSGGVLRPDILRHLKLEIPGPSAPAAFTSAFSESDRLVIDRDPAQAAEQIRRFSARDAERWPEFVRFMNAGAAFLDAAYSTIMPRLPREFSWSEGYGLLELGLDLRLMGRPDMLRLIRMLPMTAVEFLEEWFESPQLKAALASVAIHSVTLGPLSAGTGFTLLHNWLNRGGLAHRNVGRSGELTRLLANAATTSGAAIRLNSTVAQVVVDRYTCKGVTLAGGEEIEAPVVVSSVDPKRTFLGLTGAVNLPPEFVWQVQAIKMRGSVARLHLLTDGQHGIPSGTVVVAPSIEYLERAYDAAKYGEISAQPYLEITSADNVVSVHIQFAPFHLKKGSWGENGDRLRSSVMRQLDAYFPRLAASIRETRLITPLDLERTYGLTEGDLNHGQLMLDQFMFMRPIPGWSNHRTPVDGLFLCGSGVHAGGGVSGAAGRNAARVILGRP